MVAAPARADKKPKPPIRLLGVSIVPPLALFHDKDTVIAGASVNLIYGRSRAVYGVEIGLFNQVDEDVGVLQLGGVANIAGGGCYGVCAAGLLNFHGKLSGAQLALFGNDAGSVSYGVQIGFLNAVRRRAGFVLQLGVINFNNRRLQDMIAALGAKKGDVIVVQRFRGRQRGVQLGVGNGSENYRGLQVGLFNIATEGKGVQLGAFNISQRYKGVQLGGWNHATTMRGLQIGLVNTARSLKGVQLGIINVATGNRLPVTVLVNAGF